MPNLKATMSSNFVLGGRAKGFTLLEALIAVLVLSIGLLGLGVLQVKALQSAQHSKNVSIANLVAKDVKEYIWSMLLDSDALTSQGQVTCPSLSDNSDDRILKVTSSASSFWEAGSGDPDDVSKLQGLQVEILDSFVNDSGDQEVLPDCEYIISVSWIDERIVFAGSDDELSTNRTFLNYSVRLPGYSFNGGG